MQRSAANRAGATPASNATFDTLAPRPNSAAPARTWAYPTAGRSGGGAVGGGASGTMSGVNVVMMLTLRALVVRSQVHIDHDSAAVIEEAVLLVNSDDRRSGIDTLDTVDALAEFVAERRISGSRAGSTAELRAVRRLRDRLRTIFELADDGARGEVIDALNRMIAESGAVPRLVEHDGLPVHLHFTPSRGAARTAARRRDRRGPRHRRARRRRRTAADLRSAGCGRVLVDLSKNRSRRYCDTQCGNRQHVAAYRRRRSASQTGTSTHGDR